MIVSKILHSKTLNKTLYFILFLLVSFCILEARPISYPNSWTIMQQHNWEKTTLHIHYSPKAKNSIGFLGAYYKRGNDRLYAMQWNHLLFRNNQKNSQANLYSKIHLGELERRMNQTQVFHSAFNLSFDWETRRYFFLYDVELEHTDEKFTDSNTFHHKARIGITPYIAPYGKLHTWLMLQFEHHPDESNSDNHYILTPMVRFFKGDYLCEIGLNSNNQILFNTIIRF